MNTVSRKVGKEYFFTDLVLIFGEKIRKLRDPVKPVVGACNISVGILGSPSPAVFPGLEPDCKVPYLNFCINQPAVGWIGEPDLMAIYDLVIS